MIYKAFKDISLSRLGMGCMRLPKLPGGGDRDIDYAKAGEIIDYAMAHGVNYYDTAYVYHGGQSEVFLGQALKKYPRDSFYVASKYNVGANPDYEATFSEQLERLGMDRIDFYLLHSITDERADTYLTNGCIDYFLRMRSEGRIKYLGFSFHGGLETMERFASARAWDFAQIQINYFDWAFGTARREYEILTEKGIPVIAMESVRGGRLAQLTPETDGMLKDAHPDWSVASWAFRWLKGLPDLQLALSGMTTLEQLKDNIATYADERALNLAETELLTRVCEKFHDQVKVPCTACRYCTGGCPAGIDIPKILTIYNNYKLDGVWALGALDRLESSAGPADCIGCGACVSECPQSIDIPALMSELARAAGK